MNPRLSEYGAGAPTITSQYMVIRLLIV